MIGLAALSVPPRLMLPQEHGYTRCMSHLPFVLRGEGSYSEMSIDCGTKSLCITAIILFVYGLFFLIYIFLKQTKIQRKYV